MSAECAIAFKLAVERADDSFATTKRKVTMTTTKPRRRGGARAVTAVHIETYQPQANDVYVAGSFNNWKPEATPLVPLGNGRWAKELTLPEGRYEYRLVVDGNWIADLNAQESAPNPYGSRNSVLTINGRV